MAIAAIPFGIAIGLAVGMLGGGGSVLAVPVLVYLLGQGVHEATTASLVVVTAGAVAGGLVHAREGRVCWRHAGVFTAAALPGVFAGTALGSAASGNVLLAAFAVIMVAAAVATWRRAGATVSPDPPPSLCPPLRVSRDLSAGLVIGITTGAFGIGGGFLVVPALALFLALSMRLAVGTSLAIVTATSAIGLAAHLLVAGRGIEIGVTAAMTAACVTGAIAGAALASRVPARQLERGFACLVTVVAGGLLASVTFAGGPPGH